MIAAAPFIDEPLTDAAPWQAAVAPLSADDEPLAVEDDGRRADPAELPPDAAAVERVRPLLVAWMQRQVDFMLADVPRLDDHPTTARAAAIVELLEAGAVYPVTTSRTAHRFRFGGLDASERRRTARQPQTASDAADDA